MQMKKFLATLSLAALAVAGCSSTGGSPSASTPTGTNAATPTETSSQPTTSDETETEVPTPTSTEPATLKWNETNEWEDHLSVTVTAPKAAKRGEYASGGEKFKSAVQFTITIVNKTGKAFDPSSFSMTIQSADAEGDQIFDTDGGFMGGPETKLLNGRQAKFKAAFGVANPKDIVLEVSPGYASDDSTYEPAIWTS